LNIFAVTLGCKVNQYESQAVLEFLENLGYKIVKSKTEADVIVVNSCTVTARSDQKIRQTLSKLKRESPHAILVLMGCMPQAFPEKASKISQADIIIGSLNRKYISCAIESFAKNRQKIFKVEKNLKAAEFENLSISRFLKRTRAFLKIQDGCEEFCSYCIVPFARGRIRSKKIDDILSEAKKLSDSGYKEVVLTGVNLSLYGKDFGANLIDAIEGVCSIEGIKRVRLGSLEPGVISDKFLSKITSFNKFCPDFHLSLQSGCDRILKIMNRKYVSKEYFDTVKKLRRAFDSPSISTDVLVGFPTETDEDFEKTKEFIQKIGFSKIHVFKYSERAGTKSSKMKDDVSSAAKEERSMAVSEIAAESSAKFATSQLGKIMPVLFESALKEPNYYQGFTPNCVKVKVRCDRCIKGEIIYTKMRAVQTDEKSPVIHGLLLARGEEQGMKV
jgi:threonylcarbamoyladenosine tRNA methylthiotransferase MtaB